jgi:hypothetical protein
MTNLEKLEDLTKIQCSSGNWNCNSYMHGMANGMIFALSCLKGEEPQYLKEPDVWLDDIKLDAVPMPVSGDSAA